MGRGPALQAWQGAWQAPCLRTADLLVTPARNGVWRLEELGGRAWAGRAFRTQKPAWPRLRGGAGSSKPTALSRMSMSSFSNVKILLKAYPPPSHCPDALFLVCISLWSSSLHGHLHLVATVDGLECVEPARGPPGAGGWGLCTTLTLCVAAQPPGSPAAGALSCLLLQRTA